MCALAWPAGRPVIEAWLHRLSLGLDKVETFTLIEQNNRAIAAVAWRSSGSASA
jgi:hypothetical protein